jgi:hypothetical protein
LGELVRLNTEGPIKTDGQSEACRGKKSNNFPFLFFGKSLVIAGTRQSPSGL